MSSQIQNHSEFCIGLFIEPLETRRMFSSPIKIMPLGDSITESFAPRESYRYWLWNDLQSAGYTNIDFVGSMHGVNGGEPANTNFDEDHEGHSGWRADQILAQIGNWAATYQPDVVMMHLGTNDLRADQSVASTISDLGNIIDTLRTVNPRVTILLCQIIPNDEVESTTQELDAEIPQLAASKQQMNSRIVVVNQADGFDVNADTFDGLHPNATGEQLMANKFFAALKTVLPASSRSTGPVKSNETLISRLASTATLNDTGPIELDESIANNPLSIDGQAYNHGIGVNSNSRIDYRLNGHQKYFASDLGIDDDTNGDGSVVFKVYADGKRIFCSNIIKGDDAAISILLNIKGVRHLTIIVNDAGDSTANDHADWANARVIA